MYPIPKLLLALVDISAAAINSSNPRTDKSQRSESSSNLIEPTLIADKIQSAISPSSSSG